MGNRKKKRAENHLPRHGHPKAFRFIDCPFAAYTYVQR